MRQYLEIKIICALLSAISLCFFWQTAHAESSSPIYVATSKPEERTEQLLSALTEILPDREISLVDISQSSIPRQPGTFIASGSKALTLLLENNITNPIIAVFISRIAYEQIKAKPEGIPKSVSVLFSDPSPEQQLSLIYTIFGKRAHVGILLSDKTRFMQKELESTADRVGLPAPIIEYFEPNKSVYMNFSKLLKNFKTDVILALPDANIYNEKTWPGVIRQKYRGKRLPIIGYSRQLVELGVLATVFSDIESIAKQTAGLLDAMEKNKRYKQASYLKDTDIQTNQRVASLFGFRLKPQKFILAAYKITLKRLKNENI